LTRMEKEGKVQGVATKGRGGKNEQKKERSISFKRNARGEGPAVGGGGKRGKSLKGRGRGNHYFEGNRLTIYMGFLFNIAEKDLRERERRPSYGHNENSSVKGGKKGFPLS